MSPSPRNFPKRKIDVTPSDAAFYHSLAGCHLGVGTYFFTDTKFHHLTDASTNKYTLSVKPPSPHPTLRPKFQMIFSLGTSYPCLPPIISTLHPILSCPATCLLFPLFQLTLARCHLLLLARCCLPSLASNLLLSLAGRHCLSAKPGKKLSFKSSQEPLAKQKKKPFLDRFHFSYQPCLLRPCLPMSTTHHIYIPPSSPNSSTSHVYPSPSTVMPNNMSHVYFSHSFLPQVFINYSITPKKSFKYYNICLNVFITLRNPSALLCKVV
jgi:hypothetical protein